MYGTIARFQLKPGALQAMTELGEQMAANPAPGFLAQYVYQMDANPDELFVAVIFESREAYEANANSPEQHDEFLQMRELLAADPEWHDGEIVFTSR